MHEDGFDERWRSEKRYVTCPGCGWEYTVNNDGRLRRHSRAIPGNPEWATATEGCPNSGWRVNDDGSITDS